MVQLVRHRQTKGPVTDRLHLNHRATSRLYVRRAKVSIFSRCNSYPATVAPAGSNRSGGGGNKTTEAFDGKGRKGGPASRQAVTYVNAEQASKQLNVGADPARGWGRPPSQVLGEQTRSHLRSHRGKGDGMSGHGDRRNTGSPHGGSA